MQLPFCLQSYDFILPQSDISVIKNPIKDIKVVYSSQLRI
ncbi:hypothetical protein GCWU000325_00604 [Alloprevotella tannerae ATCC 51259]|uniref:Uncharacterized protein n=1 Tax=Alloprevotella tannerae ATCC 51259 TaxID=626522 RepID=C9LEH8_9BACT|nr:hypothetical protein GCWU000325_00604 [Alloprevotella tannerae ATCC 51259]